MVTCCSLLLFTALLVFFRTSLCDGPDSSCMLAWLKIARTKVAHLPVTEPFASTQQFPRNSLISAWELLKESFEKCRTNCNECRRDIKRLTKHPKLFIKKRILSAVKSTRGRVSGWCSRRVRCQMGSKREKAARVGESGRTFLLDVRLRGCFLLDVRPCARIKNVPCVKFKIVPCCNTVCGLEITYGAFEIYTRDVWGLTSKR